MYLVAIAWIYVVLMMAVAEALSSQGSILGAVITFVLYGVLPLSIVLYIMGTPGRRRLREARQMAAESGGDAAQPASASIAPDSGHQPAGATVAPKREEA